LIKLSSLVGLTIAPLIAVVEHTEAQPAEVKAEVVVEEVVPATTDSTGVASDSTTVNYNDIAK